jgi:hypothetical protein
MRRQTVYDILKEHRARKAEKYRRIAEALADGEEVHVWDDEEILCPWCGAPQFYEGDPKYMDEESREECVACEKIFSVEVNVSYDYTTERVEQ